MANLLSPVRKFNKVTNLVSYKRHFLAIKDNELELLSDVDFTILKKIPFKCFVRKMIVQEKLGLVFLLPLPFVSTLSLYQIKSLTPVELRPLPKDCYLKDACFSPSGDKLYLLVDRIIDATTCESELFVYSLRDKSVSLFFEKEGKHFLSMEVEEQYKTLILCGKEGEIVPFYGNKVNNAIKAQVPFTKIRYLSNGQFLVNHELGFSLLSKNGTLIKKFDFLMPQELYLFDEKENKKDIGEEGLGLLLEDEDLLHRLKLRETCFDFSVDRQRNLLYFVSQLRPEKTGYLYILDLQDFSLLKRVYFNDRLQSFSVFDNHLALVGQKGTSLYTILN